MGLCGSVAAASETHPPPTTIPQKKKRNLSAGFKFGPATSRRVGGRQQKRALGQAAMTGAVMAAKRGTPQLALCVMLLMAGAWCQQELLSFNTSEPIANIAASHEHVFIASGAHLYQLDTSLRLEVNVSDASEGMKLECDDPQPGPANPGDRRKVNTLLLVSQQEGLVYTGWNWDNGRIEKRSLRDVAKVHGNQSHVVSCLPGQSSHGIVSRDTHGLYLVIAAVKTTLALGVYPKDTFNLAEHQLHLKPGETLHFVDAFLWGGAIFTPSSANTAGEATMLITRWENGEGLTLHGEGTLQCGQEGTRRTLASSSLIETSATEGLWAGVFPLLEPRGSPDDTALCIFRLPDVRDQAKGVCSSNFPRDLEACKKKGQWIRSLPILTHSGLSSVLGVVVRQHIVVFLGTEKGQLLKVTLDKDWKAGCPEILYEIEKETPVFSKLVLDPLDNRYIYLPTTFAVYRVKVSDCDRYKSCAQCLLAKDPYCGWCHSSARCTFQEDCPQGTNPEYWISIVEGVGQCLRLNFTTSSSKEISLAATANFSQGPEEVQTCRVKNTKSSTTICQSSPPCPLVWSCQAAIEDLSDDITAEIVVGSRIVSERFHFANCKHMHSRCSDCLSNGCVWCKTGSSCGSPLSPCSPPADSADKEYCRMYDTQREQELNASNRGNANEFQVIDSVEPKRISTQGKTNVTIIGKNLTEETKMVLIGTSSCTPEEVKVTRRLSSTHLEVSLPPGRKETKTLCLKFDGQKCLRGKDIKYTFPSCSHISPTKTWLSGGRQITIHGRDVDVNDRVTISVTRDLHQAAGCSGNESMCQFPSPVFGSVEVTTRCRVKLHTGAIEQECGALEYLPDPQFISYQILESVLNTEMEIKIRKEIDDLEIEEKDIEVFVKYSEKSFPCEVHIINDSAIHCRSQRDAKNTISEVIVKLGHFKVSVNPEREAEYLLRLIVIPIVLIVIIVAAVVITRRKSKQLSRKLSMKLELLEADIRNEIRHGFAELQIDQTDVVDTSGKIPFLDYKHFAVRTFFPEPFQSPDGDGQDECMALLGDLICNKRFLVTLIHVMEKQKAFSIKDRCRFASFLTIALQTKLIYLTHILEVLTRSLMDQASNAQPKLMLRRTESVVEKLLTNWMSTCLYGFLRETVGEPLFVLVTTLNQRIHKGPVDAITCKALHTLNEDWLLWQVNEFNTLTINVFFPRIPESDSEGEVGQNVPVKVLDCDSMGQAKEKIFQAFLSRNGYPYGLGLNETSLELNTGQERKELQDLDQSSVVLEHGKIKLNTVMHYQITEGSTINVIRKISRSTSDGDYTDDHCHLILPDTEDVEDLQGAHRKGKQKFKVKEMYLTKLLATKVAIDSAVETLFKSIWTVTGNKVPVAIKFFFDFLDAQYDNKKINDPDVPHIWKTNSLPLRFWVNILKNPQFVFDIKKTPHIDGCLSVIAQAFIDSFSLSEQSLGKESPTNKLLYAKDMARYKRQVEEYYKNVQDAPSLSPAEMEAFLAKESKKHENEFKENAALLELYKYITSYYDEISRVLEGEPELEDARKQLVQVKALFDERKKCHWM
ncbi:plexin-C1 isoform X2 [Ambystoma mexicanum]|uniref:plexin-C1 isoform X2 n=1 Tax=Ambystoma mexicanum TaxID=8296 RepID=UPI0037E822E2